MVKKRGILRVLVGHFFRRFFDSDTLQVEGETLTTVVRAIAIIASPGLMAAFFLQNQYPWRTQWGAIEDHYFFVLFTFLAMGAVTLFEWEMLFPDRWDFLILSPLPIRPLQMLGAKAAALGAFLFLFLFSSSIFGAVILPAVSKGTFYRQCFAQIVAVSLAGLFAALGTIAVGGILLCVLPARWFRRISPFVQAFAVTVLLLLLVQYLKYGDELQALLTRHFETARVMPTMWFLGVYERIYYGHAAPAFAGPMTRYAVRAISLAAAGVLVTYPLAWAKMRAMSIEGAAAKGRARSGWRRWVLARTVPSPVERGVFVFIAQTIARNNQYQVYLAMYLGTGLGLAIACAVTLRASGVGAEFGLSGEGLHALMPLLLFWVVAGFRAVFAFPLNLVAGWIFRMTGATVSRCADAARRWMLLCALGTGVLIVAAMALVGWGPRQLLVQAVCGFCLAVFLVDAFFGRYRSVPFNKARMPGNTSLPWVLTLYLGIFPLFILGVIRFERRCEAHPLGLMYPVLAMVSFHALMGWLRSGPDEVEEEMEGYEGVFQLLGLS